MELYDWKARRAGGRIAITGKNAENHEPAKIVGVDVIEPRGGNCVAVDKDNPVHTLTVA